MASPGFPYVYRWDRQGRKGQTCRVLVRGKRQRAVDPKLWWPDAVTVSWFNSRPKPKDLNSRLIEFEDGYRMVSLGNAIRRRMRRDEHAGTDDNEQAMTTPALKLFEDHILQTRAIDAAWRQIKRSTESCITLGPFVDQVMAKCPDADADYVRQELHRRLMRYRPRPRRSKRERQQALHLT